MSATRYSPAPSPQNSSPEPSGSNTSRPTTAKVPCVACSIQGICAVRSTTAADVQFAPPSVLRHSCPSFVWSATAAMRFGSAGSTATAHHGASNDGVTSAHSSFCGS